MSICIYNQLTLNTPALLVQYRGLRPNRIYSVEMESPPCETVDLPESLIEYMTFPVLENTVVRVSIPIAIDCSQTTKDWLMRCPDTDSYLIKKRVSLIDDRIFVGYLPYMGQHRGYVTGVKYGIDPTALEDVSDLGGINHVTVLTDDGVRRAIAIDTEREYSSSHTKQTQYAALKDELSRILPNLSWVSRVMGINIYTDNVVSLT